MKYLILAILLFNITSFTSEAKADEKRRDQILSIIGEELDEITRLNRQTGSRNPSLLLRMAELMLEKARLIKERENRKYLSLSPEKRQTVRKRDYFKQSRKYFKKAQKTCVFILKRFKRFKNKGAVYYILAFNAKEFQDRRKAEKFYKRAIKYSKRNGFANKKSKLALADMYYNQKKYKRSIPLYASGLSGEKKKWYTKDAFNLAWCYFRVGKKNKAINKMNEIHRLSQTGKFVNMTYAVERDLAYFYSDSGKFKQAIRFYKKIGKDISTNLLKVAKFLKNQAKFTSAQKSLVIAKKYAKTDKVKVEIDLELLSLLERFGRVKQHLATCGDLYAHFQAGRLNENQTDVLRYHVKKMGAILSKQVAAKTYVSQKRKRQRKATYAASYFNIQAGLDSKGAAESIFLAAEAFYASGKYSKSIHLYDRSYSLAVKEKNKKILSRSLNGMLASLSGRKVSKKVKDTYLVKVFNLFLARYPRGKKSYKIYQRLFTAHYEQKDISSAEKTLIRFRGSFPEAVKIQETMLAKIIDYYKDKNDKKSIKKWIARINAGQFVVSKKVAKKLKLLLLTMQFAKVERASSKGDKKRALAGYVKIYKNPETSAEAKKNASYNIAVLFYELDDAKRSFGWAERSLKLMDGVDIKKFSASFLVIATGLFGQRKFYEAASINDNTFRKLCKLRGKNRIPFFRNAVVTYLADGRIKEAKEIVKFSEKCRIPNKDIGVAQLDILKALGEHKRWSSLESYLEEVEKNTKLWSELILPANMLRKAYVETNRAVDAKRFEKKIGKYYTSSKKRKLKIPLEALDLIANAEVRKLNNSLDTLKSVKLSFPEKTFNGLLKKKFSYLDELTTRSIRIFSIGSGKGIVRSYEILIKGYQHVVDSIQGFSPVGKEAAYVKSFKNSMRQIVDPLNAKVSEYNREVRKQIQSSNILSKDNYKFFGREGAIKVEFYPPTNGVVMDKGGRR